MENFLRYRGIIDLTVYCEKVKVGFLTRGIRNNLFIFAGVIIAFAFNGCLEACGMLYIVFAFCDTSHGLASGYKK